MYLKTQPLPLKFTSFVSLHAKCAGSTNSDFRPHINYDMDLQRHVSSTFSEIGSELSYNDLRIGCLEIHPVSFLNVLFDGF